MNEKEWKLIEEVLNVIDAERVHNALIDEDVDIKTLSVDTYNLWKKMMKKSGRISNV